MLLHSNFMFSRAPQGRVPLSNLQRFSADLALLFDDLSGNRAGHSRTCSSDFTLTDTKNGLLLRAALPGLSLENLEVSVSGEEVSVRYVEPDAESSPARDQPCYHRRERRRVKLDRTFRVGYTPDRDGILATYRAGILEIHLPAALQERSYKIAVQGEFKAGEAGDE